VRVLETIRLIGEGERSEDGLWIVSKHCTDMKVDTRHGVARSKRELQVNVYSSYASFPAGF